MVCLSEHGEEIAGGRFVDDGNYRRRIEAAANDPAELRRIADELGSLGSREARHLQIIAIQKHFSSRARQANNGEPTKLGGWLAEIGIGAIDGSPLYRYGLSEEGFQRLKEALRARSAALASSPSSDLAAQFVLWAAEWFRRSYDGRGLSWDALGVELGSHCEWRHWQHLTDEGLRFWRIPPLKLNGRHYRLAAIARQGGFPLAALESAQGGWAQRYLERLVATLAAEATPDFDTANSLAGRLLELVPPTWQNNGLQVVSAELAMEVVRLRRLAEDDGIPAGALVSVWLDENLQGWREQLPLSIGSETGRVLIDGLMRTVALRGGADAVRCHRWLEIALTGRREGVTLELAGRLEGTALPVNLSSDWSRLRLYPSGLFAQQATGELAVADADEDGAWLARPTTQRTQLAIPHNVAITAELRGDGQRVGNPFVLSGGEALVGELRIYSIESEAEETARLRLVGSTSGAFRDDVLVVEMPPDWLIAPHGNEATCVAFNIGKTTERTRWKVTGAAIVTSSRGDRYLLRTSQKSVSRDRLVLNGSNVHFRLADTASLLIVGKPLAHVEELARPRPAGRDELVWRSAGTRVWQQEIAEASIGPCEFAWLDRETGHIRDRRDATVFPGDFVVRRSRIGGQLEISIGGWPGRISSSDGPAHGTNCWRLPVKGNTRSHFGASLETPDGIDFDIVIPVPHQAWIESWADGPTQINARLSLSVINRFVARASEGCELMADLLDEEGRPVSQGHARWWVEGEMPLSTIRDDLAALLRPCGKLDATIRLDFNDANNDYWFVGEFEHELRDEPRGFVPDPAVAEEGVRLACRAIHDPAREQDVGRYDLLDSLNHRPISLPKQQGDAMVYLRAADRVLSRPRLIVGQAHAHAHSPLGHAMSLPDWRERQSALRQLCEHAEADPTDDGARAFIRQLIDLVLSLNGLPPVTFDVLVMACGRPAIATMMLFQAQRDELEPLLRLAEGLPFAWWLFPKLSWHAAAEAQAEYLFARIPDEPMLVAGAISETRSELASLEPILAPLLELPTRPELLDLAANSFLTRSGDRISSCNSNPFRPNLTPELPEWRYDDQFWRALDAPIAAAMAALGKVKLDEPQLTAVKDIARRHPQWFREAFAAALKEV